MQVFKSIIQLRPLEINRREHFIRGNQEAFLYGATQEFGMRDDHFEEDGETISRRIIEAFLDADGAEAYEVMVGDVPIGGAVLHTDGGGRGSLDLLFVSPNAHNCGIGATVWNEIERLHPEVRIWETMTPYFEKRNIHFYVNRCGFHIVEFFNDHHPDPHKSNSHACIQGDMEMLRFEKVVQHQCEESHE